MRKSFCFMLALVALSCKQSNEAVEDAAARISLTVQNLPPLEGAHYQLWATFFPFNKPSDGDSPTHEDEFFLLGEFVVSENGVVQGMNGGTPQFAIPRGSNAQLLRDIVVSIELDHGLAKPLHDQPVSILMGAAFQGTERMATADMTIAYADAFKSNFAAASGRCTIVAPTSPADSNSGIWFVELGSSASAGLRNLPALPSEWRYEGWVVDSRTPRSFSSTGKFTKADSADSDGAGPNRGTGSPFNFPGQDFITVTPPRPDFRDQVYSFMVTIEPQPDNSTKPFFLTLLNVNRLNVPPGNPRSFAMTNVIASVAPTARAVVQR